MTEKNKELIEHMIEFLGEEKVIDVLTLEVRKKKEAIIKVERLMSAGDKTWKNKSISTI